MLADTEEASVGLLSIANVDTPMQ